MVVVVVVMLAGRLMLDRLYSNYVHGPCEAGSFHYCGTGLARSRNGPENPPRLLSLLIGVPYTYQ